MDGSFMTEFRNLNLVERTTLPPELIELIIDHLSGDHRSLRACSLVSHAFCHASQSQLFKTMSWIITIKQFLELVTIISKPEAIIPLVQKLILAELNCPDRRRITDAHDLLRAAIDLFVMHSSNLSAVHITSDNADVGAGFSWHAIEPLADKLSKLFRLESVSSVRLDTSGSLPMSFFRISKKITTLALDATAVTIEDCLAGPLAEADRPHPTCVRILLPLRTTDYIGSHHAMEWLISPGAPFSLDRTKKLVVQSPAKIWSYRQDERETGSLNMIVRGCERTVEELLVIPSYSILHRMVIPTTQFTALHNLPLLCSLTLILPIKYNYDAHANIFLLAGKLVTSIDRTTPNLRHIRFCVDLSGLDSSVVGGWSLLDAEIALAKVLSENLKHVEIVLTFGAWEWEDRKEYMRGIKCKMRRLKEMGKLSVHQPDECDEFS